MYHSGYNKLVGCDPSYNSSSAIMNLNAHECRLANASQFLSSIFALIGLFIHSYIIFSYNFRQDEKRAKFPPVNKIIT